MRRGRHAVETSPSASFAQQLRRLRWERGLTQEGLARRLGLTRTAICSYEAGHNHPSPQRLPELARALAVPEGALAPLLPQRPTADTPFGRAVRELRERRGWNQRQLASRIGCAASLISLYEAAGAHPTPENLGAVAAALGVPQSQLSALVAKRNPPKRTTAFGRLLRETRIARGMTQRQLAQAVGLSDDNIGSYEGANTYPREKHLPGLIARLAKALDLPAAEIEASLSQPRPVNVPTDFGHRLRQLRIDRGLTQGQLGARCGCGAGRISRYETGMSYPKTQLVRALARTLGVEAGELARLLPRPRTRTTPTPFGNELRRLRNQRGLSRAELVRRAAAGRGAICDYEFSAKRPNAPTLTALARALGVPREHLEQLLPQPKTTPLGRELRRLREQRGLSQQELATRIDRKQITISLYERGLQHPLASTVPTLARSLGVSPDQLERLLPPQPETTPFGRELKRLRQERGLTHEELAARIGRSQAMISAYEHGRNRPRAASLAALAQALGVPKEQLAELLPSRRKPTPLGQKLRRLREQRGLSQKRLAARIGRGQGTISAYERDRNRPGSADLAALAQALGVPEQQLQL